MMVYEQPEIQGSKAKTGVLGAVCATDSLAITGNQFSLCRAAQNFRVQLALGLALTKPQADLTPPPVYP
jgi:hypothetical protein